MRMKLPVAAMLGTALLVAGCKQHKEPPVENTPVEAPKPVIVPEPAPAPAPPPAKPATTPKAKPLPPTTEDQQVLDDADATGMTARVDRSGDNDAKQADTNQEQ